MLQEISSPASYRAALYIRLSKEDESEGPSQSVTNQRSLLEEFVREHHCRSMTLISTTVGAAQALTARLFGA